MKVRTPACAAARANVHRTHHIDLAVQERFRAPIGARPFGPHDAQPAWAETFEKSSPILAETNIQLEEIATLRNIFRAPGGEIIEDHHPCIALSPGLGNMRADKACSNRVTTTDSLLMAESYLALACMQS